jgi:starch-binding outer membrane protein, SusD/RagB family
MKKNLYILALATALIFTAVTSCKDQLEEATTNPNELSTDTYFQNEAEALTSVNAVYGALQHTDMYKRIYFFINDLGSDELTGNGPLQVTLGQLLSYGFDVTNGNINDYYRGFYRGIHRANLVLENLPKVNTKTDLSTRMEAEAKFLRAFFYFELVTAFGGVPIYTTPFVVGDPYPSRSTPEQVYALIEEDLTFAINNLPLRSQYAAADLGRVTKGAAQALLGKAYLFQGKNSEAVTQFKAVINSGEYALMNDYRDNFVEFNQRNEYVEFNRESLFEASFQGQNKAVGSSWGDDYPGVGEATWRAIEYGVSGFQNTSPSDALVAAYPDTDPRKMANFFGPGSKWYNGDYPFNSLGWEHKKYSLADVGGTNDLDFNGSSINMRIIRYADVLLMAAEALNALGQDAEAAGYVNQVRNRPSVNIGNLPAGQTTGTALRDAIRNERRLELALEQVRKRDLIRWGIARQVLGNKFVEGKHELLPIPQAEIDLNTNLTQNPNY